MRWSLAALVLAIVIGFAGGADQAKAGEGYIQPGSPIYYACLQKWTITNMTKSARDAYLSSVCAGRFVVY